MKTLIATFAVLGALSTVALADDHAEDDAAENACAAEETAENACADDAADEKCDCGEECAEKADKDDCDCGKCKMDDDSEEQAEAPKEEKKGKGMKKSNDGNMVSYDEDE